VGEGGRGDLAFMTAQEMALRRRPLPILRFPAVSERRRGCLPFLYIKMNITRHGAVTMRLTLADILSAALISAAAPSGMRLPGEQNRRSEF
jgi:hypothetical protein